MFMESEINTINTTQDQPHKEAASPFSKEQLDMLKMLLNNAMTPDPSTSLHAHSVGPDKGMRYFWITDSCPHTVKDVKGIPPFEVLSLAGAIADALHI